MSCLAPCPACNRHVATDATACPFCSAALPDSFAQEGACRRPQGRMSRAAKIAAGATLMAAAASCGGSAYGTSYVPDSGVDRGSMDDGSSDGSAVALYGAAPARLEQPVPLDNGAKPPAKSNG
jgi:hypothetical protein